MTTERTEELDALAREILSRHCEYMNGLERGQVTMKTSNALAAVKEALNTRSLTPQAGEGVVERVARAIAADVMSDEGIELDPDWVANGVVDWTRTARTAIAAIPPAVEELERDKGELIFLGDALGQAIEEALGTPGGKEGGFPARIKAMRRALERIAQPVFVAEPAGTPDSAWFVALNERIEIARAALGSHNG